MKKPVLFLIFNRPDVTEKVFGQIKIAKPQKLYIASDGARDNKVGEKETVEKLRNWVVENVDWDCEVKTLFRDENLGCGKAVSSAITWFFKQEPDGIILEDDCLPSQSFFTYCEELLDYYKDDKRIWHISGENPLGIVEAKNSYYFAKIQHCWGWASWADRWQHFKLDLKDYDEKFIKNFSDDKNVQKYWLNILYEMKKYKIDSWAYPWTFEIVKQNGFCINPTMNLISNIGFDGAHYSNDKDNPLLCKHTYEITKIIHPERLELDEKSTDKIYREVFHISDKYYAEILKYMRSHPLFLFRKKFWQMIKIGAYT